MTSNRSFETLSEAFPNLVHQEMDVIAPPVRNQISEPTTSTTTGPSTSTNTTSTSPGLPSLAVRNAWEENKYWEDAYYGSTSTVSGGSMNHPMSMPSSASTSPRGPSYYPPATSGMPSYRGSADFTTGTTSPHSPPLSSWYGQAPLGWEEGMAPIPSHPVSGWEGIGVIPVNGWGVIPVNGWGVIPVNGWGTIPVNGWGAIPVNGWDGLGTIPPVNGWEGMGAIPPINGRDGSGTIPPVNGWDGSGTIQPNEWEEGMGDLPPVNGFMDLMPNMGDERTGPDHIYTRAKAFHEAERKEALEAALVRCVQRRAREENRLRAIRTSEKNRQRVTRASEDLGLMPNMGDERTGPDHIKAFDEGESRQKLINRTIRESWESRKENRRQTIRKNEAQTQTVEKLKAQILMRENASSSPTPTHVTRVDSTSDESSYGSSDDSNDDSFAQALNNLKKSMDAMRMEATQRATAQGLMWGIDNAHLKSFSYLLSDGTVKDSQALVVEILLCFRREEGYTIPTSAYCMSTSGTCPEEDGKQLFLKKLSNQIQGLIGVVPRLEYS